MEDKIDGTTDVDERVGLGSLLNTIKSVLERVKEVESEGSVDVQDEELDIQQVKARMKEIQSGKEADPTGKNPKARSIDSFKVKADKRDTFLQVLSILQNVPEGSTQEHVVQENYDLCDYQFMEMLKKEADDCFKEGADIEGQQYLDLLGKINEAMAVKIGSAQQRLERILAKRDLKLMEAEATLMTRKGEVDEALVLLMEANAQQAKAAGATQAAEVITKLVQKIRDEQERSLPDEQRLLRALMRIKDSEERKGLIYQAFKPAKSANEEGEIIEGPPLISPPAFINMVRLFIQNFGNVDSFDIMGKAQLIIDEAQIVATDLYGEGMTPQQQQKFMFEKNTLSVWDLANYEEQALMSGEDIPWANDAYNDKNPEDVLGERVKRIGGME